MIVSSETAKETIGELSPKHHDLSRELQSLLPPRRDISMMMWRTHRIFGYDRVFLHDRVGIIIIIIIDSFFVARVSSSSSSDTAKETIGELSPKHHYLSLELQSLLPPRRDISMMMWRTHRIFGYDRVFLHDRVGIIITIIIDSVFVAHVSSSSSSSFSRIRALDSPPWQIRQFFSKYMWTLSM